MKLKLSLQILIKQFCFYSKEISSKFFIPFKSAHSMSMKKRMLANEGLRRLLNMSPDLLWEDSVEVMNEFVVKMTRSGYPSSWRTEAVKSAIKMHEDMIKDEQSGKRPLFRPKEFKAEERRLEKLKKQHEWHKGGKEDGVLAGAPLIICPSDGGAISRKMKEICKKFKAEHKIDVKVFERGGVKMGSIAKADPLSQKGCDRDDCFPCKSGGGGDCSKSCSAYRIECEECKKSDLSAVYEGETGRNCYSRGLEHLEGLSKEKEDNPLWKHCQLQHGGVKVKFKMVCLKSFKTAFMRQINEGVRIACCQADICMNSKSEYHQPSIVRVTTLLGNANEEQTGPQPQRRAGRGGRGRGQGRSRGSNRGRRQPGQGG